MEKKEVEMRESNKPVRSNMGSQVKGATPKSFMTNPANATGGKGSTKRSVPFTKSGITPKPGSPQKGK